MRRLMITLAAAAAIVAAGSLTWQAEAQTSRGAAALPATVHNFSPVEKAACGPVRGRYCGRWHHLVCGPYHRHCWCAPC